MKAALIASAVIHLLALAAIPSTPSAPAAGACDTDLEILANSVDHPVTDDVIHVAQ